MRKKNQSDLAWGDPCSMASRNPTLRAGTPCKGRGRPVISSSTTPEACFTSMMMAVMVVEVQPAEVTPMMTDGTDCTWSLCFD